MLGESDCASRWARPGPHRDAYYWRLFGTALSFFVFGTGALLVGGLLLPLVRLMPAPRALRRTRVRAVVRLGLRFFVGQMHRVGVLTYELHGVQRLGRAGQLIVANHPSLIDVVFLLAFTPAAGCVVKHSLWRNPLMSMVVRLAQYTPNEPAAAMIESAVQALREGQVLVIFPEGTRTSPGQAPLFQRGAANVALRAQAIVTPVYIHVEPATLTKAQPWYRIAWRRPHFRFEVGEDFDLAAYQGLPLPRASRLFNEQLRAHFHEHCA